MSEPTTTRGVQLPCPRCGERDANILHSLAQVGVFRCEECDCEFSADDLKAIIARWTPILKWVDAFPHPKPGE
jgi:uncharacterized protein (DUF983 family)